MGDEEINKSKINPILAGFGLMLVGIAILIGGLYYINNIKDTCHAITCTATFSDNTTIKNDHICGGYMDALAWASIVDKQFDANTKAIVKYECS